MRDTGIVAIIILILNVWVSYKGFKNQLFFERLKFEVDKILIDKDYKRLITSGFLHIGWAHLIFNMITLILFSNNIEKYLGEAQFLLIYMVSLTGGNLFSLLVHRHHGDYSAVGASGAICGIVFASIALFPGMGIGFFGIPFHIPGWLYGLIYVLYSIYGIKSKTGNIGHEAHLGGALVGMIVALLLVPDAFLENYTTILVITIPTIIFIFLIIKRPHALLIDNFFFKQHQVTYNIEQKYNIEKNMRQQEIDIILDKINKKGIKSLSNNEKEKLKEYSRKL